MRLTQQQLEAHLWGAANILRGKTAGQDYKNSEPEEYRCSRERDQLASLGPEGDPLPVSSCRVEHVGYGQGRKALV